MLRGRVCTLSQVRRIKVDIKRSSLIGTDLSRLRFLSFPLHRQMAQHGNQGDCKPSTVQAWTHTKPPPTATRYWIMFHRWLCQTFARVGQKSLVISSSSTNKPRHSFQPFKPVPSSAIKATFRSRNTIRSPSGTIHNQGSATVQLSFRHWEQARKFENDEIDDERECVSCILLRWASQKIWS